MSVCPGCGRCRECGHRASPRPVPSPYPLPYTTPYIPGQPYPLPSTGTPIPWQQQYGTVQITNTARGTPHV